MHMTFWWDANIGDFFFKNLNINGTAALIALCVCLGGFSILFESMKVHDAKTKARAARERSSSFAASETANLLADLTASSPPLMHRMRKAALELLMFLTHNALGYLLMLAVMVYNGYLFIAVIVGMGIGYFVFGHKTMKINMENIQARTTNTICSARYNDTESVITESVEGPSISGNSQQNLTTAVINHRETGRL